MLWNIYRSKWFIIVSDFLFFLIWKREKKIFMKKCCLLLDVIVKMKQNMQITGKQLWNIFYGLLWSVVSKYNTIRLYKKNVSLSWRVKDLKWERNIQHTEVFYLSLLKILDRSHQCNGCCDSQLCYGWFR